ncbi:N-acetylmuramoyl-L-alanine amidase [Exiguobacterium sp. s183]|uniref:N-acetylmuramoyl-L-alanine amidase n=1 Tax=Exiguobacterium sp. s183 TaxID=2751262 RepID=UPI001BE772AB|nr:N-acetylmuramoyl-L-alanine amidase [Exiguobacterium sp. s183]
MLKSKLHTKLFISSTLIVSAVTFTPFDFQSPSSLNYRVEAATKYYTTTVNLNLRKMASTSGTILTTIPAGKTVTYISTYGSWYRVSYNGTVGYVSSQYLKTYQPTTVKTYTTTANLNLRKMASTSGTILTTIPSGKEVIYLSTYGSWYRVSYNGTIGYVSSQYVKVTSSSTITPDATATYYTTANLNLRKMASTSGTILLTIPSGSAVTYLSTYGSWYRVTYKGVTGYVSSQYVTTSSGGDTDTSQKTVVIDAGHGGNDPGAVYGSVYEKVIALDMAKRLMSTLTNTYDYNVKLTRSTDMYLSLSERVSLSKSYKADVFVSLHANSSVYSSAHGHEVLVPTTESYTTNPYVSASRSLGSSINQEIGSRISAVQNRGVKYQNVYVVGKNVVPSTLVEYGFISNSNDRAYLTNATNRQQMANATATGIHQFMRSYY